MFKRPFLAFSLFIALSFLLLAAAPSPGQAQSGGACSALAQVALQQVEQNCAGLGRNAACYGYNQVSVTFNRDVPEEFFSRPADRADVIDLDSIQTSAYTLADEDWGIAVMKLQANIPNTLPGQSVTFVLMGDTEVQNAVTADQAALPSDAVVTVEAQTRSNIRSRPTLRANVVRIVDAGQTLEADAIDASGEWLRVVFNDVPGWITRGAVSRVEASALPVITSETFAPMQAFYLKTQFGAPSCNEAPSVLLIQGPRQVAIDLKINEASITISSTILARTVDENTMELIVLDGQALVNNLIVPAGFKTYAPLGQPDETLVFPVIVGSWEDCLPLTPDERAALQPITNVPAGILSYPVTIPEQTNADCRPQPAPITSPATIAGVDCRNFRPTSPLGGANYGLNTFFWDAAPGATRYRVNLFNSGGFYAGSVNTRGVETNTLVDTGMLGGGFSFSWNVEALVNGQVVCETNRVMMALGAPPAPLGQPTRSPLPTPTAAVTPT